VTTIIDNNAITAPRSVWQLLDPAAFLASGATWAGVLVGALFILGAVQLRLRRAEA
jgi:hypothetical protein